MDPNSPPDVVRMYVSDVQDHAREEISESGTAYAGANYGWQEREGPCDYTGAKSCAVREGFVDPGEYGKYALVLWLR